MGRTMADMTTGRMADHWWWRPGWRPGRRMYSFHFTFEDQPAVCELATAYQARLADLAGLDLGADAVGRQGFPQRNPGNIGRRGPPAASLRILGSS
jgi:hypothetical protein